MYNPYSLEGKTILVTGASSGIGRGVAIEASKMGAHVIITARNEERLQETMSLLEGSGHSSIVADLAQQEDLNTLVTNLPPLDGVVHSAGITIPKPFKFYSQENIDAVMNVNFRASVLLTHQLLKKKLIRKGGSIVFISSISGVWVSYAGGTMYAASKGAVNGFCKALAIELAPNIRVNCVNPGMIETNILSGGELSQEQLDYDAQQNYPMKRYGKPQEVAHAVVYLLSDAASWVTGSNLLIDGGYTLK